MKQILQNLSNGETRLENVPCPTGSKGSLLISTQITLVSAGTERMLIDFGKANLLAKARQQPDKVKMVLGKIKTDGLLPTIEAVRSKLDQPISLGYCNAGVVLESGAEGFSIGDRVVSNGNHAEVVRVPKNLCVKIPNTVDDESAAFTVLAAIGLQGIRLIEPTLGETVIVTGLGLIGLMTVQMLRANGCRVMGIDFDSKRCELAMQFGAETVDLSKGEDPIVKAQVFSRGRGVDAVIVAASTQSDEVMHQAAEMCRKRGRIVLVGVVGLNLRRDDFFQKEISFQVSASYGPGRYDPDYEEKGHDYPVGFVRWTEQRNFEAVLDMMAEGTLDVKPLITHRFSIDKADSAYGELNKSETLGVMILYPDSDVTSLKKRTVLLNDSEKQYPAGQPVVGFIGAGNYASRILIPAFKAAGAGLECIVTSAGVSGVHHGKKIGFRSASTELEEIYNNEVINTVIIVTRHDTHAGQVLEAIKARKNVFVEKPMALKLKELSQIDEVFQLINIETENSIRLMVGFNRRFAPHIIKMKELLSSKSEPMTIILTINAGAIPGDHWTQDNDVGGGRIIGEGCHFIDLARFLAGSPIKSHHSIMIGGTSGTGVRSDKVTITLSFDNGSFATIHYLAHGGKSFPKERIEVFCENGVLQMDNYRMMTGFDWPGFKRMKLYKQDKGQAACAKAFVDAIRNGKPSPIPYDEVMESSRISIEVAESLKS
jgi:predicted dehydrogenase/threonine dehydrogenase-like Zn-dependent dehydrogenase